MLLLYIWHRNGTDNVISNMSSPSFKIYLQYLPRVSVPVETGPVRGRISNLDYLPLSFYVASCLLRKRFSLENFCSFARALSPSRPSDFNLFPAKRAGPTTRIFPDAVWPLLVQLSLVRLSGPLLPFQALRVALLRPDVCETREPGVELQSLLVSLMEVSVGPLCLCKCGPALGKQVAMVIDLLSPI